MIDPPVPGIPALLLAAAAKLGWRPTTRAPDGSELGKLGEQHLIMVLGDSPGSVTWALLPDLPPGFGAVLLSEASAKVLSGGRLLDSGAVSFDGQAYRLEVYVDGGLWTARAVVVESSAT